MSTEKEAGIKKASEIQSRGATRNPGIKTDLHSRNKNREPYNLSALIGVNPELANYIKPNKYGQDSIDFSDPAAIRILNKAILHYYYKIEYWEFPQENLTPPIPGRADYIHYVADLLSENNYGEVPTGDRITCLDIGIGASCIYPIIGVAEYNWKFIGSDTDPNSIDCANNIVNNNEALKGKVNCRLQRDPRDIFYGILESHERIDIAICNPPFHSSMKDALEGTRRKVKNLSGEDAAETIHNFAGVSSELIYDGGEYEFVQNIIYESEVFAKYFYWFSTLVSKQSHLSGIYKTLQKLGAKQIRTIPMGTGNKSSRIVLWTFLSKVEQKEWAQTRWPDK